MEESKPVSIPVEDSKSISHLIKENESHSFTDRTRKGNHKHYSNEQYCTDKDDDNSHIFEETRQEIKTKTTKHTEIEDDETNELETAHIPINDSQLNPILPLLTHYENNSPTVLQVSTNLNTTIDYLESNNSTIANARLSDLSNVQLIHQLTNDRLPMADLNSQYHVVSQHGYNTSTSSINTGDTRSSTPTFQRHASLMTGTSDSDEGDELGDVEKAYGIYDIKSHSLDSNVEIEDIMLTSFKNSDEIGAENDMTEQNILIHETFLTEPPPLPFSQPPQTPPTLKINGDGFTDTIQVNGNHVVQNMSNEMYKTMKQAIKPGKVNELKKIFANYFEDHDIENMFLPAKYRENQKHLNTDSPKNVITVDTQQEVGNPDVSIEGNKSTLSRENNLEKVMVKEKNLSYDELFYQVTQMQETEEHGGHNDKKRQNQQEQSLFKESQSPVSAVQHLLNTSIDLSDVKSSNSVQVYSTPDYPLTTQNDHVSIPNTTITTTKFTLVTMTPTEKKVSESKCNNVSKEIKPVLLAPPHLLAATTERETIWKSDKEAGLLQEADLSKEIKRVVTESMKETDKKEKRDRERYGQEWKEEQYKINLKCVYIEGESAAVVKKERETLNIREKQEEKVEDEIRRLSEDDENEIWTIAAENYIYGKKNEAKFEKQSDKLESNATKATKTHDDITGIKNKLSSDKQKLDLHQQNVISASCFEEGALLEEFLTNENKENSEHVKTETLATIGPRTVSSVVSSNKAPLLFGDETSLLNSDSFVGYNNSTLSATLKDESVNYVAVPSCQINDIQATPSTHSHVVDATYSIESSAAVSLPFPTIKEINGLLVSDGSGNSQLKTTVNENNIKNSKCLSKLQPELKSDGVHAKEVDGNDNERENKLRRAVKNEAGESVNEVTKVKGKYEEIIEGSITQERNAISSSSTAIRRSKSEVVPIKKEYPLLRAKSIHRSEMIPPIVHSATASKKSITGTTICSFKALRQMFEEGCPLKRNDEDEYLPSANKSSPSSNNVYNANTEEAEYNSYSEAHHKISSKTARGNDVYLSKQPATKINKSKITCKTAATTTNHINTANNVTSKFNRLLPNTSTTGSLSSAPPDGCLREINNFTSSLHRNAVVSDNPGVVNLSISDFEEKEIPLKSPILRKVNTDKIFKAIDEQDRNSKDLNAAKKSTLEKGEKLLQSSRLNTLPLVFQANQRQPESLTPKQNNINKSSMNPPNGNDNETDEKVSSFRIHTHLSETDNRSRMEEIRLSPNSPDDYSTATKVNTAEDNQYISQTEVNSGLLVEESVQNILVVKSKEEKLFAQNNNFESVIPENTALISNVPISVVSNLTQDSSLVVADTCLTPTRNIQLSNVNSEHLNILATNEITQTVVATAHPRLVKEDILDGNISINTSTSTQCVGVDSTSHDPLFSNNGSCVIMNSISVSSLPETQYYSDSQYSVDTWQTAPNSTTLFTTLTPDTTGLTSSDQRQLSSTWNVGIPIQANVILNAHHHSHEQRQKVLKQDVISSATASTVDARNTDSTEKPENQTPSNIQSNVSRRIVGYENTAESHNFKRQKPNSLTGIQKADILINKEGAEATYEKVKRNLRPIPAKNQNAFDLNVSTEKTSDSSVDDCFQITDMSSSLRSPQDPAYYSVNESITSATEKDRKEHIDEQNNTDHQYAVVRLTPSNTDSSKVKNTIYCQVDIKTSSPNLTRQRSDLSHASVSTLSTVASDAEDELSDANDSSSDKQFKKINVTVHKDTESVERDLMREEDAYKTDKNILLISAQPENVREQRAYHLSEITIDSGTKYTEIISPEDEVENQETTETWYEYETIPYEKYEEMNKSTSTERTVKSSYRSLPPSSVSLTTSTETPVQPNNRDNTSVTKSDSSQIYKMHTEPESVSIEGEEDLRIVRGRLLIKNTIDSPKDGDDFDDNINVFAEEFHLDKENPLYESDPDIFKHIQEEEEEENITLDQVHQQTNAEVMMKAEIKGTQNLSNLLLSRLNKIDSKDIKQSINVEHHHEEIYGDIDFIHADGTKAKSDYTENFDSIAENVELLLKSGKAVILIKVIVERIVPIDYEFNVWRKNSAIVTRQIEIDLLASEQRKRLYNHVMENSGIQRTIQPQKYGSYLERTKETKETVLNSQETFRLFNQLLTVAENSSAEGGVQNEVYSEKTDRLALQKPSISDFMY